MNNNFLFTSTIRSVLILACTLTLTIGCQKDETDPVVNPPTVPDNTPTEEFIQVDLASTFIEESFPLRIFLPAVYEDNKNLSVIYGLEGIQQVEGFVLFEEIVSANRRLGLDAIVVAIGDHLANPDEDEIAKRRRYLFPNGCGGDGGEGHLNFYKYITQEVVPYINENYTNDHNSRSLVGFAWGGVFTIDAMFRAVPENVIFHNFISAVPLFGGCGTSYFDEILQSSTFSEISENIKIHFTESNETNIGWLNTFMEGQDFSFLDFDYKSFEDQDNVNSIKSSFEEGLKFIFNL